jgi:hypothetical protein
MLNRKSARQFASAALVALGVAAAGAAHAGDVQWSVSVNLPPIGVPVYHVPAPVYHPPMPAPVVVYRPAPPPVVVYRPVPVVDHRDWGHRYDHPRHQHHRHHRHHGHHGHHRDDHRGGHDDHGDRDDRGGRWEPGPRQRHH